MGGSDTASQIEARVTETFASVTVDGVTFHDLTNPAGAAHEHMSVSSGGGCTAGRPATAAAAGRSRAPRA